MFTFYIKLRFEAMQRELLILFLVSTVAFASDGPFSGHKVIRVIPKTDVELSALETLAQDSPHLDIWQYPSKVNAPVDIRLSPVVYDDVISALYDHGMETHVLIEDVQELMEGQKRTANRSPSLKFDYSNYHTFQEINDWMDNQANKYPSLVTILPVTNSYEGRPLKAIKISAPSTSVKPAFVILGGIHAREWLSPATVIYMAGQLMSGYKKDKKITIMIRKFDWYILPVTNPDGYVYSWKNESTRLWRKTRSKHHNDSDCVGVDPNRNWNKNWCKNGVVSNDPCSDVYCGPTPFSEVEVKGVAEFIQSIPNVTAFLDIHAYSQMWMTPWSYTYRLPPDYEDQYLGAKFAVTAIKRMFQTKYTYGSAARTIYAASGISADWAYGKAGIKYSYAVELRDTGEYGFLLPPDQIIPTGKETLSGVMYLAKYINNKK